MLLVGKDVLTIMEARVHGKNSIGIFLGAADFQLEC